MDGRQRPASLVCGETQTMGAGDTFTSVEPSFVLRGDMGKDSIAAVRRKLFLRATGASDDMTAWCEDSTSAPSASPYVARVGEVVVHHLVTSPPIISAGVANRVQTPGVHDTGPSLSIAGSSYGTDRHVPSVPSFVAAEPRDVASAWGYASGHVGNLCPPAMSSFDFPPHHSSVFFSPSITLPVHSIHACPPLAATSHTPDHHMLASSTFHTPDQHMPASSTPPSLPSPHSHPHHNISSHLTPRQSPLMCTPVQASPQSPLLCTPVQASTPTSAMATPLETLHIMSPLAGGSSLCDDVGNNGQACAVETRPALVRGPRDVRDALPSQEEVDGDARGDTPHALGEAGNPADKGSEAQDIHAGFDINHPADRGEDDNLGGKDAISSAGQGVKDKPVREGVECSGGRGAMDKPGGKDDKCSGGEGAKDKAGGKDVNTQKERRTAPNGKWGEEETIALLKIRCEQLAVKGKNSEKKGAAKSNTKVWEEISADLAKESFKRDLKECKRRWNTVKRWFGKVNDNDDRSGRQSYWKMTPSQRAQANLDFNMRRSWYDVLAPYNKRSHTTNPTHLVDTGAEEEVRPVPPAPAGEGVDDREVQLPVPPRSPEGGGGGGEGQAGEGNARGSEIRGGGSVAGSSTMTGVAPATPSSQHRKNVSAREQTLNGVMAAMREHTDAMTKSASEQGKMNKECTELHCETLGRLCKSEMQAQKELTEMTCAVMREDIQSRGDGYALLASALRGLSRTRSRRRRREPSESEQSGVCSRRRHSESSESDDSESESS